MALEITEANFEEVVMKSDKPVLVDFWAEWCGPCRMVGPVVDELATEYEGKAVVGKLNVDSEGAVAQQFGVRNIPTFWSSKTERSLISKLVRRASKCSLPSLMAPCRPPATKHFEPRAAGSGFFVGKNEFSTFFGNYL